MSTAIEVLSSSPENLANLTSNKEITPIKTKFPLVSVVIPVYNGSKYISAAINSVFEQTYGSYEIIVIDDGSTDDTRKCLKAYEDKIRYIYQANEGSASARNLGIKIAKGELIAFLDADDYWATPDKLAKQIVCFQNNPHLGCVNTGWQIVDAQSKQIGTVKPWLYAPELNLETWLKEKCVRTSAMIFSRHWLEKVGGFDEELKQSHDVDLILRLTLAGCKTVWLKEETTCYRQHKGNTTRNNLKQAECVQKVLDKFFAHKNLPANILALESDTKYHTLVWLAWYQYRAKDLDKMSELLQQSLAFTPYLRPENIACWLTDFEKFSHEKGEKFDVNLIIDSLQWQELVNLTLGIQEMNTNKIVDTKPKEKIITQKDRVYKTNKIHHQIDTPVQFIKNLSEITLKKKKISSNHNILVKLKVFPQQELFLLPSVSEENTTDSLFNFGSHSTPEAYVTAIENGRAFVTKNSSYVIAKNDALVVDLCSNIDSLGKSYTVPQGYFSDRPVAFLALGRTSSTNLDSIFDLVARIKLLELSGTPLDLVAAFVVDKCHLKFATPILNSMGIDSQKIFTTQEYSCIKAKILFVPSFAKKKQKISRWGCDFIRNSLDLTKLATNDKYPELIYIKVAKQNKYKISNESELVKRLIDFGFTILDFDAIHPIQRLVYIAKARCAIFGDSNYIDNIFVSSIGTKIIEMLPEKQISNYYWRLSNIASLEHYHLIAKKIDYKNSEQKANLVRVDLDSLKKIMITARLLEA